MNWARQRAMIAWDGHLVMCMYIYCIQYVFFFACCRLGDRERVKIGPLVLKDCVFVTCTLMLMCVCVCSSPIYPATLYGERWTCAACLIHIYTQISLGVLVFSKGISDLRPTDYGTLYTTHSRSVLAARQVEAQQQLYCCSV